MARLASIVMARRAARLARKCKRPQMTLPRSLSPPLLGEGWGEGSIRELGAGGAPHPDPLPARIARGEGAQAPCRDPVSVSPEHGVALRPRLRILHKSSSA